MDATGQTYSYYFTRKYLPTMIFSLFCVALSLLLIPVQLLLKQSPYTKALFQDRILHNACFQYYAEQTQRQKWKNGLYYIGL